MADKCWLMYSRLGAYTLPWQENGREYRVFLDGNGKLDELAVHESAREIAWHGGNAARMLPFWPHPRLEIIRYFGKGISEFNDKYFEDWRKIFEIYNQYDVVPFFELFDFCGTREGPRINNPWNVPFAGDTSETVTGNFFWGPESQWLREIYIDRMLKISRGLKVGWGGCNEPRKPVPAKFLAETHIQLIRYGVDPGLIVLPIDYARKEQKGTWSHKLYPEFKKLIQDELGEDWDMRLKTDCISPMHNCTIENLKEMWGPDVSPGHIRQMCYSLDGVRNPRPDRFGVKRIFTLILSTKYKVADDGKVHFEVVNKQEGDPPDSMEGASDAYFDFYGKLPANWHVNKKIKPPEDPPIEEPEPKSITILSPSLGDTIHVDANDGNLTIGITWKFTGDIKFVDIRHRSDGCLWTFISERELNDSAYEWESANLYNGKNFIQISDCYGETQATQEFEVEFRWPEEKKMSIWKRIKNFWKFIMRNWRWSLAGIVIPASIYAVIFVSPLWYLLALPILAGFVKFKIFRLEGAIPPRLKEQRNNGE